MTLSPTLRKGPNNWNPGMLNNQRFGRLGAGFTGAFQTLVAPTGTNVAVIDEIRLRHFSGTSGATGAGTATNKTVTLEIDTVSCEFNFPGSVLRIEDSTLVLPLRGSLIIPPGSVLKAKSSEASGGGQPFVKYRLVNQLTAVNEEGWDGNYVSAANHGDLTVGTRTAMSANSTYAGGATLSAATVGANRCIEVVAIIITGHSFNAAADSVLLEFSDGAATHRKIYRANIQGVDPFWAPQTVIVPRKLRGPKGYGLYVTNTANVGGAGTTTVKTVVLYRFVPDPETWDPTGIAGTANSGSARYWWCYDESTTVNTTTRIFPATGVPTQMVAMLNGYAFNGMTTGGFTSPSAAVSIGAYNTGTPGVSNGGFTESMILTGDDFNSAGNALSRKLINNEVHMAVNINSLGLAFDRFVPAGTLAANAQLAWGTLHSDYQYTKSGEWTGQGLP